MNSDAWPPFHPDPEHPPASHPGSIADCPTCRPDLSATDELAIAIAVENTAYVFDALFPGSGARLREACANAIPSIHQAMTYWICGAATELDYYQGVPA